MKHSITSTTILILGALSAQASLITSVPAGATTTVFASGSATSCSGIVDAGFALTGSSCANYSGNFDFGLNGQWNGFAMIGGNSASSAMVINLGGLFSSVGGFLNYDTPVTSGCGEGGCSKDPLIIALDANKVILATYDISVLAPIDTPGAQNSGAFVGIQDATNDIAYLELSGDYLSIHSISLGTTGVSAAPEPSTVLLLGAGLGLLSANRRRRLIGGRFPTFAPLLHLFGVSSKKPAVSPQ
jgi:hypothetical protein